MRRRSPFQSLAASPTMVGAVTVLIAIVAVFLAYNANNGLPFVPVYRVSVEVPNAARVTNNNEVRIGGHRVGVIESIEPVQEDESETTAQVDGNAAEQAAADTGGVAARLNLKLDKSAQPLPKDSVFRVRYKSAFGLKYLEVVRGTGDPAPEGFTFDGTDDGAVCPLPVSADDPPADGSGGNGCFQEQTEFDDINNTFDEPTRENSRRNLEGYGNAFAARGFSLNQTLEGIRPLLVNLKPVSEALLEPETRFRRFFPALGRTSAIVAPVANENAELFGFMATTFGAISSDPEALKETISEGPPTLATGIDTLPRQRPFLEDFTTLTRELRPGVSDLRFTLPTLNDAIEVGTPVLNRSVSMNELLEDAFQELLQLVQNPSTRTTLMRLEDTIDTATPLVQTVAPAQTVCNYWNYWFNYFANALSDRDQVGFTWRQALTNFPPGEEHVNVNLPILGFTPLTVPGEVKTPVAGYSGLSANGKAGAAPDPSDEGKFKPYDLPILNGQPYGPGGQVPAQPGREDCQGGQNGYGLGQVRTPGQPLNNPAIVKSDLPGSRGPTTLYWNTDSTRESRYTVNPDRTPLSWQQQGLTP